QCSRSRTPARHCRCTSRVACSSPCGSPAPTATAGRTSAWDCTSCASSLSSTAARRGPRTWPTARACAFSFACPAERAPSPGRLYLDALRRQVFVVAAAEVLDAAVAAQFDDAGGKRADELAVVRHKDERARVTLQSDLQ